MGIDFVTLALAKKYADSKTGQGSGASVQPDWNQNDETKPDYVKNRPFWTGDPVETVLLNTSAIFDGEPIRTPCTHEFHVGETYRVTWDGVEYTCVAQELEGTAVIGNLLIIGSEVDTGEPFLIMTIDGFLALATNSTGEHSFKVTGLLPEVHKLNENYLPDTLVKTKYSEYTATYIDFNAVLVSFGLYIPIASSIEDTEEFNLSASRWNDFLTLLNEFNGDNSCVCHERGFVVDGVRSNNGRPTFSVYHMTYDTNGKLYLIRYTLSLTYNEETSVVTATRTVTTSEGI